MHIWVIDCCIHANLSAVWYLVYICFLNFLLSFSITLVGSIANYDVFYHSEKTLVDLVNIYVLFLNVLHRRLNKVILC